MRREKEWKRRGGGDAIKGRRKSGTKVGGKDGT